MCPSADEWTKKMWYIYICVCVCVCLYISHKKNEIMPFAATWMDPENIILSEVKTRQSLYDITYIWDLKNNTNEVIYKRETDS